MTKASRQSAGHCPDCGRSVEAGADLCSCGFPLMFLRQEEPDAAVLKPSRRPAEADDTHDRDDIDDTDELPVVVASPLSPPTPNAPSALPPDSVVCASCDEVNPDSRTWCARCGAALRERRDLTEVLMASPAPRPRRRALLVAGAAIVVVAAGAAGTWVLTRQDAPDSGRPDAEAGSLAIGTVTASATATPSTDNAGNEVTYAGANVADQDPTTAWRVLGDGVGVELLLPLDGERTVTEVALVPGYAKTDPVPGSDQVSDRFEENGRVTRARWVFDDGEEHVQVIESPTRNWERSALSEPVTTASVRLVIEESQPGTRRDGRTTAISEIELVGH